MRIVRGLGEGLKTLTIDPHQQGAHHGVRSTVDSTRPDPVTTQEWRDSIRAVAEQWGEGKHAAFSMRPWNQPVMLALTLKSSKRPTSTPFIPTTKAPTLVIWRWKNASTASFAGAR